MKNTKTIPFYLYGTLENVTAVLYVLGIQFQVEEIADSNGISYKNLIFPNNYQIESIISNVCIYLNQL